MAKKPSLGDAFRKKLGENKTRVAEERRHAQEAAQLTRVRIIRERADSELGKRAEVLTQSVADAMKTVEAGRTYRFQGLEDVYQIDASLKWEDISKMKNFKRIDALCRRVDIRLDTGYRHVPKSEYYDSDLGCSITMGGYNVIELKVDFERPYAKPATRAAAAPRR